MVECEEGCPLPETDEVPEAPDPLDADADGSPKDSCPDPSGWIDCPEDESVMAVELLSVDNPGVFSMVLQDAVMLMMSSAKIVVPEKIISIYRKKSCNYLDGLYNARNE